MQEYLSHLLVRFFKCIQSLPMAMEQIPTHSLVIVPAVWLVSHVFQSHRRNFVLKCKNGNTTKKLYEVYGYIYYYCDYCCGRVFIVRG